MRMMTLEELGKRLPVPLKDATRPSFDFRPWRFEEEKKIGKLKQKFPHLGRFVRELFYFMLSEWNGKSWLEIDENERKVILNQLSWANVFYMYICLRIDALGEEMKMHKFDCPSCTGPILEMLANLNSIEVKVSGFKEVENSDSELPVWEEDAEFERSTIYDLKKPFTVGEVKVIGLKCGYTPWDAMEKLNAHDRNEGSVKESMMRASLESALTEEGGEVALDKNKILNHMTKRDIEGYYDKLDDFNGGPKLALEIECPHCGGKNDMAFNWTYDYFFGNSSL